MKKIIIVILGSLVLGIIIWLRINIFTSPDIAYAKQTEWMYEKGWRVKGDLLLFEDNDVYNDTIYKNHYPVAIIKRTYESHYTMIIESINKKEIGMYREIGAHLEDEHLGRYDMLILILLDIIY